MRNSVYFVAVAAETAFVVPAVVEIAEAASRFDIFPKEACQLEILVSGKEALVRGPTVELDVGLVAAAVG